MEVLSFSFGFNEHLYIILSHLLLYGKEHVKMPKLIMVSNRLPVSVEKRKEKLRFKRSVGGVATGLGSIYKRYDSVWVGWPGIVVDKMGEKEETEKRLMSKFNCHPVFLSQNDVEGYYHGFCNRTIWPLFHYFTQYVTYDKRSWESYKHVNKLFGDEIVKMAGEGDTIWIHDYHLMLLPQLVRKELPEARIGFFLHIPFPSSEIFRLLPWRDEILEGFLGADLIGFHIYDYVRHFLISVHRLLGYENVMGQITVKDRTLRIDTFPMGVEYERFQSTSKETDIQDRIAKLRKRLGDRKIILSIDRLDYTKGIPKRLEAFEIFLKRYPEYRDEVTFILVSVPSRTAVEHYRLLKKETDELVGRINGEFGTIGWTPISYMYRLLPFSNLVALYNIADVAVITPIRDGMNLIAKEYVATKTDGKGVLILSETAGTSKELCEAIIVNPNDEEGVAKAIREALTMPEEERVKRSRAMQKRLQRYDIVKWGEEFMERLSSTKKLQKRMLTKGLDPELSTKLIDNFQKSKNRLLFLDYDGTMIPFYGRPERARPGDAILKLLEGLARNPKNEVVIISGRDKHSLDGWFGGLEVNLVAEHGVWIKESGGSWELSGPLRNDWKREIRPILEHYVDRTPGSFIEEKGFSLVWHYRKTDPELGSVRVRELTDDLVNLTANLNLQVLEGSRAIEIKNTGVNKGQAALRWLSKDWGFIMAAGDDATDEDLFGALPDSAYSIKVGLGPSRAKFNLSSTDDVLQLLKELIDEPQDRLFR